MRASAFPAAGEYEMFEGIEAGLGDVGVAVEIPGDIEERMGIAALVGAAGKEMLPGIGVFCKHSGVLR
jgi:hypothetical protein